MPENIGIMNTADRRSAHHDRFNQDGYLLIPDFLAPGEVDAVEEGIRSAIARSAPRERDAGRYNLDKVGDAAFDASAPPKRPYMLRKIQGAVFEVPELLTLFTGARMLDAIESLMGGDIYYHSSKVFFKAAHGGCPKPWHQDAAYWAQFAPRQLTAWVAVHDADVGNGCVWVIPGSHRLGLIPHVAQELQVPDSRIDRSRAMPVPVPRGGLLIFHALVLHMSERNSSARDRWAAICDYDCLPNACIDACIDADALRRPGMEADGVWPLRRAGLPAASPAAG
jgi:phytanoyl-CoA hydroxylase